MVTLKNKNHHDNDRIRSTSFWRSNPRSTTLANAAVKANGAKKASTRYVSKVVKYRVFKLDLHQKNRLLGHQKYTFKS
jgi:hypothetical protein